MCHLLYFPNYNKYWKCTSNTDTPLTLLTGGITVVGHVWRHVPVLVWLSDVCKRPCKSVANDRLPRKSYGNFKLFKISDSDFGTMSMHRRFQAYTFLTTAAEGVVHGVYKVVIQSYFHLIR